MFPTLCDSIDCITPALPVPHYLPGLPKFMSTESVMLSNYVILCCPILLLPSIFPSIRVFSNESALLIRWTKYWSFSFSPSSEYSGLITLQSKGLKSLLQHHNLKASIFQCSAFFMVQPLHLVQDYWKNLALTTWTFISKVMSAF